MSQRILSLALKLITFTFTNSVVKYRLKNNHILLISLLVLLFLSGNVSAQIETGDKKPGAGGKAEEKVEEPFSEDSLSGVNYYYSGLVMLSHRFYQDESVYGTYGIRYNEIPSIRGGMTLGLNIPMNDFIRLDIGVTYFGGGEKFDFASEVNDSVFQYVRRYLQLGIPIRLRFTTGQRFQAFFITGLTPANIIQIRYDQYFKSAIGTEVDSDEEKIKNGFTGFQLMASAGAGVQYNFKYIGYFCMLEYRQHLMNSYDMNEVPLKHKQFAVGLNFGAYLRF